MNWDSDERARVKSSRARYLDLMKKALSYSLWEEQGIPLEVYAQRSSFFTRFAIRATAAILRAFELQIRLNRGMMESLREEGRIWPSQAHTMIGIPRLDNLQECIETTLEDGVPGDLIEAGAWRGGVCIFMRAVLASHGCTDRKVIVADSFAGLPPPDAGSYPKDAGDQHHKVEFLSVSEDEVRENFRKYDLLDDQVVFLSGWFRDTLPNAPVEELSVLRVDGDMYGSTMEALTHLYPKLSTGGYCIVDDYALEGAQQAVDDFRREQGVRPKLQSIDWTGVYWRKD